MLAESSPTLLYFVYLLAYFCSFRWVTRDEVHERNRLGYVPINAVTIYGHVVVHVAIYGNEWVWTLFD